MKTINQVIPNLNAEITLYIKREDLIHPFVSGNKYRKLKYNLIEAKAQNKPCLLTFGGAFSNHIAAVAAASKRDGFHSIGIIRGDELINKVQENPTLKFAIDNQMHLDFISREAYRKKDTPFFIENLIEKFGDFYLLPEGGTNEFAIKGCEEILTDDDFVFDYICCAAGTGGTAAGIINSSKPHQKVLVFPALKGIFMKKTLERLSKKRNWQVIEGYDFNGYGKISSELVAFINDFYQRTAIPLDPVYTGKMLFGVIDLIAQGFFPKGSRVLAIHSGGLQGIAGMNIKLKNKKLPTIEFND